MFFFIFRSGDKTQPWQNETLTLNDFNLMPNVDTTLTVLPEPRSQVFSPHVVPHTRKIWGTHTIIHHYALAQQSWVREKTWSAVPWPWFLLNLRFNSETESPPPEPWHRLPGRLRGMIPMLPNLNHQKLSNRCLLPDWHCTWIPFFILWGNKFASCWH